MGNVLLARILEYFNGTLFLDDNYRFCVFFIENYIYNIFYSNMWCFYLNNNRKNNVKLVINVIKFK